MPSDRIKPTLTYVAEVPVEAGNEARLVFSFTMMTETENMRGCVEEFVRTVIAAGNEALMEKSHSGQGRYEGMVDRIPQVPIE